MRHEYRKISRIIDELTTFFLEKKATDIKLSIQVLDNKEVITITASPVGHMKKVIQDLQNVLSYPREIEMEEYYWELAGECDYSSELGIVGTMIDKASIDYDDECISLELIRKK